MPSIAINQRRAAKDNWSLIRWSGTKGDALEFEGQTQQIAHLGRLALIGEIAASLAHELNQPLTAIVSNAGAGQRFLASGVIDINELRELLDDIASDAERAGKIIRCIREMVMKREPRREPVDMNQVVKEVVRLTKTDAVSRSCTTVTDLEEPALVDGDPVQLQQVLLNLMLNALDAMQDTPVPLRRVVLSTKSEAGGVVRTSVRDFGAGLSDKARQRIFEHFFTTKKDGLGMGLVIARSIVESFGGVLDANNASGEGACFYFTLPAPPQELHERPAPEHSVCR
jgi:two-component system sensor kinase FixL